MLGIIETIKEIASAIKEAFSYGNTKTSRQSETVVIKNTKNLRKANDYAEQIIFLVDRFFFSDISKLEPIDLDHFQHEYFKLRKKFFKYN